VPRWLIITIGVLVAIILAVIAIIMLDRVM
jgi:hypothetical protein